MKSHIVKNNQNIIDLAILTYGTQEAVFKLMLDNNKTDLPGSFVPGETITYDESDELFDVNVAKIRQNDSLKSIELATTDSEMLASGSFNKSFNISFK